MTDHLSWPLEEKNLCRNNHERRVRSSSPPPVWYFFFRFQNDIYVGRWVSHWTYYEAEIRIAYEYVGSYVLSDCSIFDIFAI